MLDEDGGQEGDAGQPAHERPNGADAVRERGAEDGFLRVGVGHGVDAADEGDDVEAVGGGGAGEGRGAGEVGGHAVLEDDAADGDADGLAEAAEEGEHGGGDGDVLGRGRGLDREGHGGEEQADADARDEHEEDPGRGAGGRGEEVEQARAEGRQSPADPERPAVEARFGGDDADDHGAGNDGQGLRERGDAGEDRGEVVGAFEEEGHVVEDGPEDDAVDEGEEVGDVGVFVPENGEGEEGVGCEFGLMDDEDAEAEYADDDGDEGVPAGPGEHDAAPGDGYEKGCRRAEEDDRADVVDFDQLLFQSPFPVLEFEEGNDADETDGHDGQVEIKDPAPGIHLGEGTADQRA